MLLVDYLPHKTTMTGPYYGELLKKLLQAVKEGEMERNADPMSTAAARQCTGARLELHEPYSHGHRS